MWGVLIEGGMWGVGGGSVRGRGDERVATGRTLTACRAALGFIANRSRVFMSHHTSGVVFTSQSLRLGCVCPHRVRPPE